MLRFLQQARIITFAAILTIAAVVVVPVRAATVATIDDTVTSQATSTTSNHTVVFTIGTNIGEGETISLTFDASFGTASITEDDVDIDDDGADLKTAPDCSGSDEVSVSMAADVLTVFTCPGDGASIASGSVVTIEIGDNATAFGTGSNQITNPANPGTYGIKLLTSDGENGNIWVPMAVPGEVVLQAIVGPSTVIIGSRDQDGCGDSMAPNISNVVVNDITGDSATIEWDTDEAATSVVNYGPDIGYGSSVISTALVSSHSVLLPDLTEGAVHHFAVSSVDYCGNVSTSGDFTFTTIDEVAPLILSFEVTDITTTSAVVSWETNETTTGVLRYGLTSTYSAIVFSPDTDTMHSVLLTSLTPDTIYHFEIIAMDLLDNVADTGDQTFRTLPDLAPTNPLNLIATPGNEEILLTWGNPPDPDFSRVHLVWKLESFPTSVLDGDEIYTGPLESFLHTGLTNGVEYFYALYAEDLSGNLSSGAFDSAIPFGPEVEGPTCGDDICEDPETAGSCPADCEGVPGEPVCGDRVCEDPETAASCPTDCGDEPTGPICGDDICEAPESTITCSEDCGTPPGGFCGDRVCQEIETAESCPADCEVPRCGNSICEAEESAESCPEDCVIEIIPPRPTGGGTLVEARFLVALDRIELFPVVGEVDVLPTRPIAVRISVLNVPEGAQLMLDVADNMYGFALEEGGYTARLVAPAQSGQVEVGIKSILGEDEYLLASYVWDLNPFGFTFERFESGSERVGFSRVTLLSNETGIFYPWGSAVYGQLNPTTTPVDGSFAWYAPIGEYVVTAEKSGYFTAQTASIFAANSIVAEQIEMERKPPPVIEVITSPGPLPDKPVEVPGAILKRAALIVDALRSVPEVQLSVDIVLPAIIVLAAAILAALLLGFDLLPLLQYLITSPLILFWRRRRKKWGIVYDAVTKVPIDLAIVRLYRLSDGRLVQSRVTDKEGRYFFLVDPGKYRIGVTKQGYSFPTQYLAGQRSDGGYLDLYHGEVIEVAEEHATVAANIPLDSLSTGKQHIPRKIRIKNFLRSIQKVIAPLGVILALFVFVVRPKIYTAVILAIQIIVYFLFVRLAKPRKPKGWGIVYDRRTGGPIKNAIVRIFEPKYDKLLQTTVTDNKGRYTFLVGPNEYYLRYEKNKYEPLEVRPVDYTDKKEASDIAIDVKLDPKNGKK